LEDCNTATDDDPILGAARATVLDFGVRRATLTEVARRAGLSRMTVYRRFADAPELMRALMSAEFGAVLASARREAATAPSGRARAVGEVGGTVERLLEHPLMLRLLELDAEAMLPYLTERLGEFQRAARAALASAIAGGQADGTIRAGDPEALAGSVELACRGLVIATRSLDPVQRRAGVAELELMVDSYLAPG
jgi:AcrR family transcriptional regulator